jgi:hypothetical protein
MPPCRTNPAYSYSSHLTTHPNLFRPCTVYPWEVLAWPPTMTFSSRTLCSDAFLHRVCPLCPCICSCSYLGYKVLASEILCPTGRFVRGRFVTVPTEHFTIQGQAVCEDGGVWEPRVPGVTNIQN